MIMATTTRYSNAAEFFSETRVPRLGRLLSSLRTTWEAIGEGFAASKRYHQLTSRGMAHEQAASKVFFEHFSDR
jgi:hypothetical protein